MSQFTATEGKSVRLGLTQQRRSVRFSRKLASILIAFAFALLLIPQKLDAQTTPTPQNLQVSSTGLLTWDAVDEATHYVLWYLSSGVWRVGLYSQYALPSTATSFQMTTPRWSHATIQTSVRLTAYGPNGESEPSISVDISSATIPDPVVSLGTIGNVSVSCNRSLPRPSLPIHAGSEGRNVVRATWDAVSGATYYWGVMQYYREDGSAHSGWSGYFRDFSRPINEMFFVQRGTSDGAATYTLSITPANHSGQRGPNFAVSGQACVNLGNAPARRSEPANQPTPQPTVDRGQQTVQHNEQMITEHGYQVTTQYGLQTISLRPLNPQDCAAIGNQAVCDMDLLDAVDISGFAEQGIRLCFPPARPSIIHALARCQRRGDQPADGAAGGIAGGTGRRHDLRSRFIGPGSWCWWSRTRPCCCKRAKHLR